MICGTRFLRLARPFLRVINSKPTTDDARREKLRSLHQLGTLLRKHIPGRSIYGKEQFARFAEAIEHNSSWLYKVWRFPDRYDKGDLDELCKTPISWGHVVLLLPLDKSQRRKYQQMAARRRWTVEDLRRVLQERFKPLRKVGCGCEAVGKPAEGARGEMPSGLAGAFLASSWGLHSIVSGASWAGRRRAGITAFVAELAACLRTVEPILASPRQSRFLEICCRLLTSCF